MLTKFYFLLEDLPSVIGPSTAGAAAAASDTAADAANTAATVGGGLNMTWMLLIYAVIIAAFYYFTIRPQRKRDKQMKEMQSSIKAGDNIVTSGGLFGRVADIGEDCFIIEFGTNRGVRVPVRKADVLGIQAPKTTPVPKEAITDENKK